MLALPPVQRKSRILWGKYRWPRSVMGNCVFVWGPQMGKYAWLPKSGQQLLGTYSSDSNGKRVYNHRTGLVEHFLQNNMPITGAQEPARTNLLKNSQDFSAASWTRSCSVDADYAVAPDGTTTADRLYPGNGERNYAFGVLDASGTYCASAYFKITNVATQNRPLFSIYDGVNFTNDYFNFSTLTWTHSGGSLTRVANGYEALPNGWYRIWQVYTVNATPGSGSFSFVVDSSMSENIIWGAQLEAGAYPTSYIPTTSAAVARSADAFRFTNAALINPLRDKCSVLYVGALPGANSVSGSYFGYGSLNNSANTYKDSLELRADDTAGGTLHAVEYDASGGSSFQAVGAKVLAAGEVFAHLVTREVAGPSLAAYCNGSLVGSIASGTPATTFDRIEIGGHWSGGVRSGANLYLVALFDRTLTAAEAKEITNNPRRYAYTPY